MIHATRRVASVHIGAGVAVAPVTGAATVVAEHRPFAIVISTDVYELDPLEFDALSRDVGAKLVAVDTDRRAPVKIADEIAPLLVAATAAHAGG